MDGVNDPLIERVFGAALNNATSPNEIPDAIPMPWLSDNCDDPVDVPIARFPVEVMIRKGAPVEDDTVNAETPGIAFTRNVEFELVALIPENCPLSIREDVPIVVGVTHRVAYPVTPPVRTAVAVSPSEEVATHDVDVPVERSSDPTCPEALAPSSRDPPRERLPLTVADPARSEVIDAAAEERLVKYELIAESVEEKRDDDVA